VDWIGRAKERRKRRAVVNKVKNSSVHIRCGNSYMEGQLLPSQEGFCLFVRDPCSSCQERNMSSS